MRESRKRENDLFHDSFLLREELALSFDFFKCLLFYIVIFIRYKTMIHSCLKYSTLVWTLVNSRVNNL